MIHRDLKPQNVLVSNRAERGAEVLQVAGAMRLCDGGCVCGVWCVECCVWRVWSVVCGVWTIVCGYMRAMCAGCVMCVVCVEWGSGRFGVPFVVCHLNVVRLWAGPHLSGACEGLF